MQVSSAMLRFASPVFDAMFRSEMAETASKRIKVDASSRAAFATFYQLMLPGAWSPSKINEMNVDELLVLSDYYQVEFLKVACEDVLLSLPVTAPRIIQAKTFGLRKQYSHCVDAFACPNCKEDLTSLQGAPDILMDLVL